MRNKQYRIQFLAASLTVAWCTGAWWIADSRYLSSAQGLIAEETHITEERADDLSDSIRRNLHYLSGVPHLVALKEQVQKAAQRSGSDSHPSSLPYEQRRQRWTHDPAFNAINRYLAEAQVDLDADIIFIINAAGDCIAASNWATPGSPIGTNYADRSYFATNRTGKPGMQYAMGKTTHIPGLYFSSPILIDGRFMGAVVAKADIPNLSFLTKQTDAYIADLNGVIVQAHDKSVEMHALPDAAVSSIPAQVRMERYQRLTFPTLAIERWQDRDFPSLQYLVGAKGPHLRATRTLQEYGLKLYVKNDLTQLSVLKRERLGTFLLLAVFGSMLILSVSGVLLYLRTVSLSKRLLQENVEKLRGLFELSPLGIALTDLHGRYIEFNSAFRDICGYPDAELKTLDYWTLTPRKYEALEQTQLEALRQTGSYGPYEKEYVRKDGRHVPIRLNGMLVTGRDNQRYIWSIVEDITEKKQKDELIWTQANFDELTGLPNRRLLLDRLMHTLASSARSGREGALLFIDMDNFKTLNDTLGHDIGDLMLQQVAQRLQSCVREGDTVARLGGDEFVVLLEDLSKETMAAAEQTEIIGQKILGVLNQPYQLTSHLHRCTASIGAVVFSGHMQSIDELMKHADIAMYQAKKDGRNTLRFFDPQMQEAVNTRAALEDELRTALDQQQFRLHYQIQVGSQHQALGAEALIRWQHPQRGLVSPAEFIPLAEETGLILPMGLWALDMACLQLKAWAQDALTRELVLAVNVSARQFRQSGFVPQIQAAVQRHAINPRLLKLELTESLLLENVEGTIATMSALNDIGVQLSLDDFGTGYSSLQYLKRLPLTQLKIDRSFVRDLAVDSNDRAIVRTIIAMAQSLNLDVIAEGVETTEQLQLLQNKGCTHFQGYLFGKPVPVEQFEAQLRRR